MISTEKELNERIAENVTRIKERHIIAAVQLEIAIITYDDLSEELKKHYTSDDIFFSTYELVMKK